MRERKRRWNVVHVDVVLALGENMPSFLFSFRKASSSRGPVRLEEVHRPSSPCRDHFILGGRQRPARHVSRAGTRREPQIPKD